MNSNKFIHQVFQLSRTMVNNLDKRMAEYNLNHSQLVIFQYLIKRVDSSSLVDIAHYLNVEKSSVTRTVNRLENRGFIEQVPSKDKRERRIKLTDSGKEVYAYIHRIEEKFENNALQGISNEALEAAFQTLLRIYNNIHESGEKKSE